MMHSCLLVHIKLKMQRVYLVFSLYHLSQTHWSFKLHPCTYSLCLRYAQVSSLYMWYIIHMLLILHTFFIVKTNVVLVILLLEIHVDRNTFIHAETPKPLFL